MRCWAFAIPAFLAQLPRCVNAAEPEPKVSAIESGGSEHSSVTRSYAWQTLLVDGASLSFVLLGSAASEPGRDQSLNPGTWLVGGGIGGYLVGAPIVHLAHRQPIRALASLGLRGALPFILVSAGVAVPGHCPYDYQIDQSTRRTWCDVSYVGPWELAVFAPAIVLDALLLAREEVSSEQSPRTNTLASLRIYPTWSWHVSALGIGMLGEF